MDMRMMMILCMGCGLHWGMGLHWGIGLHWGWDYMDHVLHGLVVVHCGWDLHERSRCITGETACEGFALSTELHRTVILHLDIWRTWLMAEYVYNRMAPRRTTKDLAYNVSCDLLMTQM